MSIKHIVFILLLFRCFLLHAQERPLQFENFSAKNGLPHFSVNHMLEDHLGFLWLATNSGLFRYDGYDLKEYLHDVLDETSISSPGIHHIVEDQLGRIWVSNMYGVNLLDRRTGTFSRFLPHPAEVGSKGKNIIRDLHVDRENRLFALGNENLFLFDETSKDFKIINSADQPSIRYRTGSMIETKNGTIWCTVGTGLIKILPTDTLFRFVLPDPDTTSGYNKGVHLIAPAGDNKIWMYTSEGLALFDSESLALEKDILPTDFQSERIATMTTIKDGGLLMSFVNNGLGVYHSKDNFQHYYHSDEIFNSLHNNNIRYILEDQFENIWLATAAGISKITADKTGFKLLQNKSGLDQRANNIRRIHKDQQGTIWTNTEIGIYAKSEKEDIGKKILINPQANEQANTDFFYEDSEGNLWIPVYGQGIWKKEKSATHFEEVPLDDFLKNAHVYKIVEDYKEKNIIWLGTSAGLVKLNTETLQYSLYQPKDHLSTVKSNRIIVFAEHKDEIWVYYTYYNSIGRFDKKTEKFELIKPPAEKQYMLEGVFRDMIVSADGIVWIATNFGLTQYNIKQNSFNIYTKRDGLINNDINAVIIDKKDQVWVTGQQFIAKYEKENNTFASFNVAENIKNFWSRAAHLSHDGQLLFGSLNGTFAFYPDSIQGDQVAPKIILTGFKVRDATFLLDQAFEYTDNIVLSHDQNDISFEFSGIHYNDPTTNQYQCLLEGYDHNWRDLGHNHQVSYTNLNPGQFTFRLKASNKDGLWNEKELTIGVLITPPFTQTFWFRALIVLILASLVYVIFRNRQHQLALKAQKELAEKSAEYKTRFLADVSHEIRTPMNAIIGLSKLTLDTDLDKKQSKFVGAIQESSKNLLTIINDLLDHTKLEAGKFTFVKKPFELNDITRQLANIFNYKADEKQLIFDLTIKDKIPQKIIGDPIRLNQILTNLLGNALKFTEKGKVWLHINKQEESDQNIKLRFEVGDTGIGIPKDKIDSIFESFNQADSGVNKGMEGTGLGLSIARQLVEKQGGHLFIESQLAKGTRLWFDLIFEKINIEKNSQPKKKSHFTIDQLKVLVVEDTYFNQMLVVEILKKHIKNPEIVVAENGKIALEKLNKQSFDIILMDVKMPVMDGFQATKIIRNSIDENIKNIPILAVTASAVPEQLSKCKTAGMDDYITKPINESELVKKMFLMTQDSNTSAP